jgi:hypothetical protein
MMNSQSNEFRKTISGFVIFVIFFVLSVFLFPFVALVAHNFLPRMLVNYLFFWPQVLLLPYGLRGTDFYYGYGTLGFVATTFWLLFALAFGWLSRNFGIRLKAFAVFPFVILITVSIYFIFGVFGLAPNLEGF